METQRDLGARAIELPHACKLCGDPTEDATHFIACCAALERVRLISSAPSSVQALQPDHVMDVILDTNWIPDSETQFFVLSFSVILNRFNFLTLQ
jgi:hypothetical protein